MLQELTVRDGADRMETVLAWYLDAFPEFELSQYPIRLSPAHFEHPVEKDPNSSPLPAPVPRVPMDDEGYDTEPEDIWAGGEGYDVWGADEPEDSSDLVLGNIQALKFMKPQVQGTSLCTWGVIRKELHSKYWN